MNGSTPVHDDNGNTVPLREYIEALIAERDKAVKEAMRQMERRLAGLNELRRSVEQDRSLLLTREKFDADHSALEDRVSAIERDPAWVGRGGSLVTLSAINARLESVETWKGKAVLVMAGVTIIAGLVGAAIMRLFTGFFGI